MSLNYSQENNIGRYKICDIAKALGILLHALWVRFILRGILLHILTNDRKMDTSKNTQSIDQNASRNSIKDIFQTLVVGLWIGGKISIRYDRIFKVPISNILDLSNMQVSFCKNTKIKQKTSGFFQDNNKDLFEYRKNNLTVIRLRSVHSKNPSPILIM